MTTLPIHQLPAERMSKLTKSAKRAMRIEQNKREHAEHEEIKEKLQDWIERNIVADDPRSQEEQMRDEMSPDRSSVWFTLFVIAGMAALVIGWALIF